MKNLWLLILAALLTFVIVMSGFDWWYFLAVRNGILNYIFFPAIVLGGLVPILLPVILLVLGKRKYAYALGLSAFLGWFSSSFIKAFTGRLQPNLTNLNYDISHAFNFGFWEHGIFWGWPSSHTTVAFAVSVAYFTILQNSKDKNLKKYGYLAIAWALYVGIGVSLSIHWFSDFIAGVILGTIIGREVGNRFK